MACWAGKVQEPGSQPGLGVRGPWEPQGEGNWALAQLLGLPLSWAEQGVLLTPGLGFCGWALRAAGWGVQQTFMSTYCVPGMVRGQQLSAKVGRVSPVSRDTGSQIFS